ncbi:glutamic-type intramembrane protease PrsW [Paenibacillus sp. y28]|uniref:glutamic-type intramembrane protease PrsW n=1 Tax=Paenibacillus sp. y28 TaxID=3129110 RepID=UPI003018914E
MDWLALLTAAVTPGIALLAYFYLKDRYEPEPIYMVLRVFLFGVLLVFPTIVLQRTLVLATSENPFWYAFVISAGLEEFMKWFVMYFIVYKLAAFDEPYDGIVYAVAVSLGFATLENTIYIFLNDSSFSTILYRAFLPVSGHALFGVTMGYYLGKAKFNPPAHRRLILLALFLPILWHGLYDYILLRFQTHWIWLILPLMAFMWGKSLYKVNQANRESPLHTLRREEEVKMGSSGQ